MLRINGCPLQQKKKIISSVILSMHVRKPTHVPPIFLKCDSPSTSMNNLKKKKNRISTRAEKSRSLQGTSLKPEVVRLSLCSVFHATIM